MADNQIPVTKTAVVEDSVTHQAGDGMTANHANATETPDIFDNTAQPAVKQVTETVPAETIALANPNVTPADIATEGSTVTTPSDNINPNGVADLTNTTDTTAPKEITITQKAVVEDSVTHQAGEGITANMSSSLETPDIFVNEAQAAVKQVTETVPVEAVERVVEPKAATLQETVQGANTVVANLETLSDGTVDIPRDGH